MFARRFFMKHRFGFLILALATSLPSQLPTLDLRTEGVIGVFAGNSFQTSLNHHKITESLVLAESFVRGSQDLAHTKSSATRLETGCRIVLDTLSLGRGASTGTSTTVQSQPCPQVYDFSVSSKVRQFVDILVQYRGSVQGSARAAAGVSSVVGNHTLMPDGANHTVWMRGLPLSSIATSVRILVDGQASGSSVGSVTWDITVSMLPVTRCAVSEDRLSCPGVGSLHARILGIDGNDAIQIDMAVTTLALTPPTFATLLIAPTGDTISNVAGFADASCVLLASNPLAIGGRPAAAGVAQFRVSIPPSLVGAIWLQTLLTRSSGASPIFATTNTIKVACR